MNHHQKSHNTSNLTITITKWYRYTSEVKQESLANANVSKRQPWYIGHNSPNCPSLRNAKQYQCNLYIIEKYFQCATIPLLTMRVYLHSFSHCCLPNMWTSASECAPTNPSQTGWQLIYIPWRDRRLELSMSVVTYWDSLSDSMQTHIIARNYTDFNGN